MSFAFFTFFRKLEKLFNLKSDLVINDLKIPKTRDL